jgi:hypothetical protein
MHIHEVSAGGTAGPRTGLMRRLRPGKAVTTALVVMTLASGMALVSAAPGWAGTYHPVNVNTASRLGSAGGLPVAGAAVTSATVCPVHGCYQIKETGLGPTPPAAEYAAEELMIAAGCHLIDVPVNDFQALPGSIWEDHAIGICLG